MSRLTTILIDDEHLAIAELKEMLKAHPVVDIVAVADQVDEAIELIHKLRPDLIFLDINMPGKDGFGMLEELDYMPHIIFVTAYDDYAIKAFEFNALDYLLKPINPVRLSEAVQRAQKTIAFSKQTDTEQKLDLKKRIFVKDGDRCYFIPLAEIFLIESVGNYSQVFYKDQKPLMHKSLTYLEERLPKSEFFRTNRKQIINLNFIKDIEPYFSSTLLVTLLNGKKIEVSQRQTSRFKEFCGI